MIRVGCCGTFDYELHDGHKEFIEYCSHFGKVTVFVTADITVQANKGHLPKYSQKLRMRNLKPLVDNVVMLLGIPDKDQQIILNCNLDYYIFGPDQNTGWDKTLKRYLEMVGVQVIYFWHKKKFSTTKILKEKGLI